MSEETEQKIQQLQLYEQSVQNIILQKQQFQSQITEIESALKELETATISYRIIGNIMVNSEKEAIKRDLELRKSQAEMRIKALEKQESKIKEKAQTLQSEIMKKMDEEK